MSARVVRFCVHGLVHVCLYTLPRAVYTIAVCVPVTLYERMRGVPAGATRWARERHVRIVASRTCAAAQRSSLLRRLGLDTRDSATYVGPLYNGHIHTMLGALRPGRRVAYTRETLSAADGNPICLDWLRVAADNRNGNGNNVSGARVKGVLLVVPGLGNYGQTPYIQRLARAAVRRGYDCCVLTPRGMGSAPLTTPNIICACFTADTHVVLRARLHPSRLAADYGAAVPVFALGYSMGCNMLIRCLAEEDDQRTQPQPQHTMGHTSSSSTAAAATTVVPATPSVACCVCVNGSYDMVKATDNMRGGVGKLLYEKHMRDILYNYVRKHAHVLVKGLPRFADAPQRFVDYCRRIRHVREYDEVMTAPHFGYANAAAYYADANALQWLRHVTSVPVVCLAAADDPLVGAVLPEHAWQALADARPNVVYVQTPVGGHLGYVRDPCSEWRDGASYLQTFPLSIFDSVVTAAATATTARDKGN